MKIVVLDLDEAHNQRLQSALARDAKSEILFCKSTDDLTEVLNANPALDAKKAAMEKSLVDGASMLSRTSENLTATLKLIGEKRLIVNQQTDPAEAAVRAATLAEIQGLEEQVKKSETLKSKLEIAIAARQKEVEAISAVVLKEDQKKVDIVLVDRSFLGNLPSDWIIEFRGKITLEENKTVPVVTMGYNEDLNYIKQTLHGGVGDYFVKPVDLLLAKHAVSKISGDTNDQEAKVFELATKADVKILKMATVVKLSEFDVSVQTGSSFDLQELVEFYAETFGGEKGSRILARCLKVQEDPATKGFFIADFAFVGHTPATMNGMRKWLRAQYVALKQKEE